MQPNDNIPQTPLSGNEPSVSVLPTQTTPQPQSSAVLIVKQWLTYGLWSWTLLSLSVLLSSTLTYFIIKGHYDYNFVLYVLAALVCLLPIAYIADRLYVKAEPEHKHGFAAVVMVIHAVLVFLISLGALITAVVTTLSIFTDANVANSKYVVITSSLLIAILGVLFFVRIMQPAKLQRFSRSFPLIVVVASVVALAAAIAGPIRSEAANKQDRLVEQNINGIVVAISDYTRSNAHLPGSLSDISLDSTYQQDAKLLVTRNLVEYHILSHDSNDASGNTVKSTSQAGVRLSTTLLRYQLCVTYKHASGSGTVPSQTYDIAYIDTSSHPAGRQCYTLTAYTY